jgi:cell division protein FtsQ
VDRSFALPLPRRLPAPTLPRGRARTALVGMLVALPLLGAGWLWLRNSPLVAVEHVHVHGAHGTEAHAIDVALEEAATHMSTLNVNVGALRAAVAPFHVVRTLQVNASFPHTLSIRVIDQLPVAALVVNGVKTAVAADGAVLGMSLLKSSLPTVPGAPGEPLSGGRVHSAGALAALAVLGAVPPALAGWVTRVYSGREGLTVAMRNGLLIYFGDATRTHAKWLAALRVLANPSSAGAWYVDVRLPERPAAGLSGGASGEAGATTGNTSSGVSASDPTAAALAATLDEAVNGGSSGASAPATAAAPGSTETATGPSETAAPSGAASTSSPATAPSASGPLGSTPTAETPSSTGAGGAEATPAATAPAGPAPGG